MQGRLVVAQPAPLDDVAAARVELLQRFVQPAGSPHFPILALQRFRRIGLIVPQVSRGCIGFRFVIAIGVGKRIERNITTAQPRLHLQHVIGTDAQLPGDGVYFLAVQPAQSFFGAAQLEKQLALGLGGGDLDDPPVTQNEFVNLGANPVHRERYQPHAVGRVEALDRLHQADVAFLNQIGQRQAVTDVTTGDVRHEAQVRHDQPLSRFQIVAQP